MQNERKQYLLFRVIQQKKNIIFIYSTKVFKSIAKYLHPNTLIILFSINYDAGSPSELVNLQ